MRVEEFAYDLPPERIAAYPADPRDGAQLLVVKGDTLADRRVRDLPELLQPGDLLVVNDTRVRPARLFGRRQTGGKVELLLLRREPSGVHAALVRANKRLRPGERIETDGGLVATLVERPDADAVWRVRFDGDVDPVLERHGHVPLPPYIKRVDEPADRERYQTIFADRAGSAAAPTAGLHFTPGLAERLDIVAVTLHVGYGTFQPVECEHVEDHRVHAEEFEVTEAAAERMRDRAGRLIAVGTTTARVLETLAHTGGLRAARGRTDLTIRPGHEFRAVEGLLTNFHLPKSSLLFLVCAFGGTERILRAYAHALERDYRFYSYGDAMLIEPGS